MDWFRDQVATAAHKCSGPRLEIRVDGDVNDGSLAVRGDGAQAFAQLKTIHPGHFDIQQDQVVRLFL